MRSDLNHAQTIGATLRGFTAPDLPGILARFVDEVFSFANENAGLADLRIAWNVFRVWQNPLIETNCEDWRLFLSWYAFHWRPESEANVQRPQSLTLAERYLGAFPAAQSMEVHALARHALKSPLDFYEVYYFQDYDRYYLKSLFLGVKQSYAFPSLMEGLTVGRIYFGKVVHLFADQGILIGHSRALPTSSKVSIARIRRNLIEKRAADFARDFWLFDSDVFNLYHDLCYGNLAAT
jgi:hypothetical protein